MACFACHQPNGAGLPGVFPPLAGSDFLKANRERAIHIPIKGLTGPVVVNGKTYRQHHATTAIQRDRQIADVLTYVMNSWGNDFGRVSTQEVTQRRARKSP